jgi:hypothetical protein
VIGGRNVGDSDISVVMTDLDDRWSISISHPSRGSAIVVLLKGMQSLAGSISIDGGAAQALNDGVQGIQVTSAGPVWATVPLDRIHYDGFE